MNRNYLEFQSDRIERVLAAHRVPVRVTGGTVSPRWIRFDLTPAMGAKVRGIRSLTEELALALGTPDVRVGRAGETLTLEMPREDAEPVRLMTLLKNLGAIPPYAACLGLADDGRPLLIRLPSPDVAHILIAGTTGSGKTELMRTILASLIHTHRPAQLQVVLIDPKRRGLALFENEPHILQMASEPEVIAAILQRLIGEMERRDQTYRSTPRIVVAVDELAEVLLLGGKFAETALTRLAQRGREAGLHLIASTQKPASAVLGPLLKANFPVRLVGRVGSAEDARVATGMAGSGAEKLLGRGDFLAIAGGQTTRFQAARIG